MGRTSDSTPTARWGSKRNGGNGKPVRLVGIVVARKTAMAVVKFRFIKRPYNIARPERIPTRLSHEIEPSPAPQSRSQDQWIVSDVQLSRHSFFPLLPSRNIK